MGNIEIKELGCFVPNKTNTLNLNRIKEFISVPHHIPWYRSPESKKIFPLMIQELSDLNPTNFQIPGLIGRNPYFDHTEIKYLVAVKNQKPVGRIAAFLDYNYSRKTGWIGCFECTEDKEAAFSLFEYSCNYLKEIGCSKVIGPAKFNAGGEVGLQIDGFENQPYFMEPYNAPYYQSFFDQYGFKKENDWYSICTDAILSGDYIKRASRVTSMLTNGRRSNKYNGYEIRNMDFDRLDSEIPIIRDLYNQIWNEGRHPQQVIITDSEFRTLALGIRDIALPELIFLIHKNGNPVGISVNLPDINEAISSYDRNYSYIPGNKFYSPRDLKRDICIFMDIRRRLKKKSFTRSRLLILGIKKEHRKNGLDLKLYQTIVQRTSAMGITHGSASQLADINLDIINPILKLGKLAITWRVYKKEL